MENPNETSVDLTQFLHRSTLAKADGINISMQSSISHVQSSKMSVCLEHHDYVMLIFLRLILLFFNL